LAKKIARLRLSRAATLSLAVCAIAAFSPARLAAQESAPQPATKDNYWRLFVFGAAASLLAHETAHIITSYAVGAHPYIGLDHGRPTVFSGINSKLHPDKQFWFSAAGLITQTVLNEGILDIPHDRGSAIERGILASGIGTTLFYITLGRNASVSDISVMARTSSLSKTKLSLIFGGVSAIQAWRIARDPRYDHFFFRPSESGAEVGLSF
jgi:hypothetical protein